LFAPPAARAVGTSRCWLMPVHARAEMRADAAPIVEHYLAATAAGRAGERAHAALQGPHPGRRPDGSWEHVGRRADRWMRTIHLGPLHYREGFDGRRRGAPTWQPGCDRAGEATVDDAHEEGWFLNERWALPARTAARSPREPLVP